MNTAASTEATTHQLTRTYTEWRCSCGRYGVTISPSIPDGACTPTEPFPAILRESVVDVMDAHQRAELREVEMPGYHGMTFTLWVWVCSCGAEGHRPMQRGSASRGHGLHRGAAERRFEKLQDAALYGMTTQERIAYIEWSDARRAEWNAERKAAQA